MSLRDSTTAPYCPCPATEPGHYEGPFVSDWHDSDDRLWFADVALVAAFVGEAVRAELLGHTLDAQTLWDVVDDGFYGCFKNVAALDLHNAALALTSNGDFTSAPDAEARAYRLAAELVEYFCDPSPLLLEWHIQQVITAPWRSRRRARKALRRFVLTHGLNPTNADHIEVLDRGRRHGTRTPQLRYGTYLVYLGVAGDGSGHYVHADVTRSVWELLGSPRRLTRAESAMLAYANSEGLSDLEMRWRHTVSGALAKLSDFAMGV
ncbi:hypothetical protein [Nocardia alba]|uniref:Uncharacterized protein n=2 Tax=Nocardia alba TaxID=225051 RepID=A0A4R1F6D3_9NOCA|nr:hypothetical protein [Nocardia alba]TCJ88089.1 hypothetical protein DFR71_6631 [Nocardia alba]